MPASPAQLAANRANAQHSTGPRTPEGKAASARNALSHGGHASDDTMRAAIETTRNFVGITGVFDFSPADHNGLDRRAATMIQITDGQWRIAK